ncbi:MAG: rRNA maturation RNase YbeY [Bacteroidia bacterium]|nr:rRNA maturation RNase YbeY [Bacteroidia bacterium]
MRQWIADCVHREKHTLGEISYNFCSDDYLHDMNVKHLKHDTLTDIITFNLNEKKVIIGDIYISYDRVKENAKEMNLSLKIELSRVMIHGVLHLCGYKDKQKKDIIIMRQKEDYYLSLLP